MKTLALNWILIMRIALIAVALILLIFTLAILAHTQLFGSVGWHGLASVGWVTAPG